MLWQRMAFLALGVILQVGCATAPVALPKTPTTAPAATSTPSPGTLLGIAVKRLQEAESYKFKIMATHTWTFEGKPQDWAFKGEGACSGNKFRSSMEGPADTMLSVRHIDGKIEAWDTRGRISNPSTTFGGPGFGTAPYTAIAYLRKFKEVATASTTAETWHFTFKPDMVAVAALDIAHAADMERVKKVEGEAWVNKTSGNIEKEKVRVEFVGRSGASEAVTMTLEFYDYNKPVSFD